MDRPGLVWNGETAVYPFVRKSAPRDERPLMTPGQEWRSRSLLARMAADPRMGLVEIAPGVYEGPKAP
jgi:hypothetical protein